MSNKPSAQTLTVRAGLESDEQYGAVVPPLHLSSTFTYEGYGKPHTVHRIPDQIGIPKMRPCERPLAKGRKVPLTVIRRVLGENSAAAAAPTNGEPIHVEQAICADAHRASRFGIR